jgi:BASS family bile acid:Na+ symporter
MIVVQLFGLGKITALAILLMAISPVPPLVAGKELKLGSRPEYVLGLYFALALLSIITVPLLGTLVARFYSSTFSFPVSIVARNVLVVVVLPVALGVAIARWLAPNFARRAEPWVSRIAMLGLVLAVLPVLIASLPQLPPLVGDGTITAILITVVAAIAAGHLLGGEQPADRPALAISAATRHPGIAVGLAGANNADPRVTAAILLFLLVSVVAAIPYQLWVKRHITT